MKTYHDKVLAHASARLAGTSSLSDPAEIANRLRLFVRAEDQRLKMAHRNGGGGLWVARARASMLDVVAECAFRSANWPGDGGEFLGGAQNGCALVAVGGYGRGEMAPCSDLDILFLHTGRRSTQMRQLLERVLRLLWDAGLTAAHSFRTVNECIAATRSDNHLQTSLVATRLLAGNGTLYECLLSVLERERRRRSGPFLSAVLQERNERYAKFGNVVCLQEPNVKESAGGLRDFHTALWAAYARFGCVNINDLQDRSLASGEEIKRAERAYEFLLRVRYNMHLQSGRKIDRLALDVQAALAKEFGYKTDPHLLASEKFMRDYFRHAGELHAFSQSVLARATEPEKRQPGWQRWSGWQRAWSLAEPFSIKNGKLRLEDDERLFAKNPLLVFDAFSLAQAAAVPFDHTLHEAVRQNLNTVNREFRASPAAADSFLKLLRRRGRVGHALRLMHSTGFLGRYFPEFARISLLIQHDLYHHYTIDEHTLKAIESLDDLYTKPDKRRAHLRAVFDEVQDVALLYLSVLLHDMGKGRGSGHVARGVQISERICGRLQLEKEDAAKVALLVKHHVTMAQVSQRRDLTEPRVAADFAALIQTTDRLNMLLLLSYADLNAVGPGVWSEWKGALLWELYEHARRAMTGSAAPLNHPADLTRFKEHVISLLEGELPPSEVERHLALLPDRYVRTTLPESVANHLRLILRLRSHLSGLSWRQQNRAATELTVCTRDRHGLFADLAGTLTAQGVEILSAELNTREDAIAVDVLMLREAATREPVAEYKWPVIERALEAALRGETDVPALVEKWRAQHAPRRRKAISSQRSRRTHEVFCDSDAGHSATIVEVRAPDEPGLAYKIASATADLGLEIVYAKISTEKNDAFDVFYVTDAEGKKLAEPALLSLERALTERLSLGPVGATIRGGPAARGTVP
jgi:[protein-PII] uridylyltransferase